MSLPHHQFGCKPDFQFLMITKNWWKTIRLQEQRGNPKNSATEGLEKKKLAALTTLEITKDVKTNGNIL